jgi:type IV pilus assembly protein PilC
MEPMASYVPIIASTVPLVLCAIAMVLRLICGALPENASTAERRWQLFVASYVFVAMGFVSLLFTIFYTEGVGALMLVLFLLGMSQLLDAELRIAGSRRMAQQAELLWVLSTAVRGQRNIPDELEAYASAAWGRRRQSLRELASRIRSGASPTELAVPQELLSRSAAMEILSGLQSGRLEECLRSAAVRQTRELTENSANSKTQVTLTYPALVMVAAILIGAYLFYYVVPKLRKIFDDFGSPLPPITTSFFRLANSPLATLTVGAMLVYLPIMLAILIGVAEFFGWRRVSQTMLGSIWTRPYSADLLRFLSNTISTGRPLAETLAGVTQPRMSAVRAGLARGESCWDVLKQNRYLTAGEVELLQAAERVGNLPFTLRAIADGIERRWSYRLSAVLEVLGPVIIIAVAMVVAYFALAFFLPLMQLINDVK